MSQWPAWAIGSITGCLRQEPEGEAREAHHHASIQYWERTAWRGRS